MKLTLNGKPISERALSEKKKELSEQKGVKLVKISENTYKTEIRG